MSDLPPLTEERLDYWWRNAWVNWITAGELRSLIDEVRVSRARSSPPKAPQLSPHHQPKQGRQGSPVGDSPGPTPSAPVGGGHVHQGSGLDGGNVAEPQRDPASAPHHTPCRPLPSTASASGERT